MVNGVYGDRNQSRGCQETSTVGEGGMMVAGPGFCARKEENWIPERPALEADPEDLAERVPVGSAAAFQRSAVWALPLSGL